MLAHQACGAAPTLGIAAGQIRKVDCPAGGYAVQPTSPAALVEELHPGRHGRATGRCGNEAATHPTPTCPFGGIWGYKGMASPPFALKGVTDFWQGLGVNNFQSIANWLCRLEIQLA